MPNRLGSSAGEFRRGEQLVTDIAREIRMARIVSGLRQADLARAAHTTQARVSRFERGIALEIGLPQLARLAGAVGLRLAANCYPAGEPLRDAGQIALLERFRLQIARAWGWRTEVPVPTRGDLRAVDAVLTLNGCSIAVEAWTRLADLQAQSRSAQLKRRDVRATRLVILLADTWANRRAFRSASNHILASFPLGTRATLAALRAGRDPGADGIVMMRLRGSTQSRSHAEHVSAKRPAGSGGPMSHVHTTPQEVGK